MTNLAVKFLEETGSSIEDYVGMCGELVDDLIHWLGEDRVRIMYIEPDNSYGTIALVQDSPNFERFNWSYHIVAVVDGSVHDAWMPNAVLPPDEYMEAAFPNQFAVYSFPSEKSA